MENKEGKKMKTLSKVGLETGELTDEELIFIDTAIVEAARPALRAREVFEIEPLPNAGIRTVRKYAETDMSQAFISMDGDTITLDRTALSATDVSVPVISKDFEVNWRDIIASRYGGMSLDVEMGRNAARQVAEEENKLCMTGEYTGWRALGIEGLATATNRNTEASAGAWPANTITDINDAIAELEADGFTSGPYVLIGRVDWIRKLDAAVANTTQTYKSFLLQNGILSAVYADDSLYASDGGTDNAIVCVPGKENFSLQVGQDITTYRYPKETMNTLFRVYEVATPVIKRPTSICEITGLT